MSAEEVAGRVRAGRLDRNAHVFSAAMKNWTAIGSVPEFASAFGGAGAAPPPPPLGVSGKGRMHEIDFEVHGEEMQYVEITLDPQEACVAEAGAFFYMDPAI
ncbi:MAG: AIM24 family protein, partial [Thermoanaerobaculia bacterium]|nr:AIM24 family protein [Thermoanaerobaculia bacterium]